MKRYLLELAALLLGLGAIVAAPDVAVAVEVVALPIILVVAWISVVYLRIVFLRQPEPRSRFFAMLVGVSARKELLGLWFGYLVIARIGDRAGWFELPVPDTTVTSPISGLVLLIFLSSTIVYGATVYRVRRASRFVHRSLAGESELDRQDVTEDRPAV